MHVLSGRKGRHMTNEEQELETTVLQKLEAMEGVLKSFMASLEEPLQKEWQLEPVYAPASGEVHWKRRDGAPVGAGEIIGFIKNLRTGETTNIRSPAMGTLKILPKEGDVGIGETIAYIKLTSTLV